jgi:hypothetical protein
MDATMHINDVPIPDEMAKLDRDPRGYPIPWMVYRDEQGRGHFTINDDRRRDAAIRLGLCSICGGKLQRGRWFVGGPLSAFHPRGAFLDPPLHHACMRYAVQVCPFLAAPSYAKRVDAKTLSKNDTTMMLLDPTSIARRPMLFCAVMTTGQKLVGHPLSPNLVPHRPYRRVEYWRHGVRLSDDEGEALLALDRQNWPGLIDTQRTPRIVRKKVAPPLVKTRG